MQGEAIKDATGRPPNIKPPRNRWIVEPVVYVNVQGVVLGWIHVRRQRYRDVREAFTLGAFTHQWWSWSTELVVRVPSKVQGVRCFAGWRVWRWRERWAD